MSNYSMPSRSMLTTYSVAGVKFRPVNCRDQPPWVVLSHKFYSSSPQQDQRSKDPGSSPVTALRPGLNHAWEHANVRFYNGLVKKSILRDISLAFEYIAF